MKTYHCFKNSFELIFHLIFYNNFYTEAVFLKNSHYYGIPQNTTLSLYLNAPKVRDMIYEGVMIAEMTDTQILQGL